MIQFFYLRAKRNCRWPEKAVPTSLRWTCVGKGVRDDIKQRTALQGSGLEWTSCLRNGLYLTRKSLGNEFYPRREGWRSEQKGHRLKGKFAESI